MLWHDDELVRKSAARLSSVAHSALVQGADLALEIDELDGIVGFAAGRDGVGAIVTAFAIDGAMPLRMPV